MPRRSSSEWVASAIVLSIALVVSAPVLVVGVALADHVLTFHGMCGPYPIDIPAYPCGWGEYMRNFAEPFALAGLTVISIAACVAAVALVGAGWLIGTVAWLALRPRERHAREGA